MQNTDEDNDIDSISEICLEALKTLTVPCPECEYIDDEDYQCGMCDGSEEFNVVDFIIKNRDFADNLSEFDEEIFSRVSNLFFEYDELRVMWKTRSSEKCDQK